MAMLLPLAGSFRVWASLIYDLLFVGAISLAVSAVFTWVLPLLQADNVTLWVIQFGCVLALYGYFVCSWVKGGQTLGMRAWKIQLVNQQEQTLSWQLASMRFAIVLLVLILLLSASAFVIKTADLPKGIKIGLVLLWLSIPWLYILIDPNKSTLHDKLLKTHFVRLPKK